jgi:hypothetical protein
MWRVTRFLIASSVSVALVSGLIAASANLVRAQDGSPESLGWQPYTPEAAVAQPALPPTPLALAGCWSGEVDDDRAGVGTGFVFIVQKGRKITRGTKIGISFPSGPSTSHGIKGDVNSRRVLLHFQQFNCVVDARGKLASSEELTGSYHITKGCRLGGKFAGGFDFTFDAGGTTCH